MTRRALTTNRVQNRVRRVATVIVVLALLWPVLRNTDGLPLSTYPMYSGARAETISIVTAHGTTAADERLTLSMPEIAETRDPLIAQSFLNDAARAGNTETICREIAGRVGDEVITVEISMEIHNVIDHVRDRPSLIESDRLASCVVPR